MQLGKPITPDSHFIKLLLYHTTKRKMFLTDGIVTTVFLFMKTTITSPLSSHQGDVIIIELCYRMSKIIRCIELCYRMSKIIRCINYDKMCTWFSSLVRLFADQFFQAVDRLDICGYNSIILYPKKFQFGQKTVTFAGLEILMDYVKPCQKFVAAIANFPMPTNINNMCSWFGLINQVSYAFPSSEMLKQLPHLLPPNTLFTWSNQMIDLF